MTHSDPDTQPGEARDFIEVVRLTQFISGQTLKGRSGLNPKQRLAIRAAVVSMAISKNQIKISQSEMIRLLERFEEMCRRQNFEIKAQLRPAILVSLVTELWVNQRSLDASMDKLIAATAYHGAIGMRLLEEFPQFADTPHILRHAVSNCPSDPRKFLKQTLSTISEMSSEQEFSEFWDTPGIFRQAAVRNPSDPRGFLRRVEETVKTMIKEKEFHEFRDSPGLFKLAAINNPSNPRTYLRKIQRVISQLMHEQEFESFRQTPSIFRQAVVRNPEDPVGFMRKIKKSIVDLSEDKEFAEFKGKPHVLQYAAVHHPSNPREFLRREPKAAWHAMMIKKMKTVPAKSKPNRSGA